MVQERLVYNKEKDLCEVDQFGWIDLRQAYLTHTIPGNVNPEELEFDGDETLDPRNILGRPSSNFDAYEMANILNNEVQNQSQGTSAKAD